MKLLEREDLKNQILALLYQHYDSIADVSDVVDLIEQYGNVISNGITNYDIEEWAKMYCIKSPNIFGINDIYKNALITGAKAALNGDIKHITKQKGLPL